MLLPRHGALAEGSECNDQFRGVAERGVQPASDTCTDVTRQMFERTSQEAGYGDNSEGGGDKHCQMVRSNDLQQNRCWHKNQQYIESRRKNPLHAANANMTFLLCR